MQCDTEVRFTLNSICQQGQSVHASPLWLLQVTRGNDWNGFPVFPTGCVILYPSIQANIAVPQYKQSKSTQSNVLMKGNGIFYSQTWICLFNMHVFDLWFFLTNWTWERGGFSLLTADGEQFSGEAQQFTSTWHTAVLKTTCLLCGWPEWWAKRGNLHTVVEFSVLALCSHAAWNFIYYNFENLFYGNYILSWKVTRISNFRILYNFQCKYP